MLIKTVAYIRHRWLGRLSTLFALPFGLALICCFSTGLPLVFANQLTTPQKLTYAAPKGLAGGAGTAKQQLFSSYLTPHSTLPQANRPDFFAGQALAKQPWVKAPTTTTARDGLGPLYNARTCLACHANGGRGKLPEDATTPLFNSFVRISLPGKHATDGAIFDPNYGDQLQTQSVSLYHQLGLAHDPKSPEPPAEARVTVHWQDIPFTYPDGTIRTLRKPQLDIDKLAYGALPKNIQTSLRNAPPLTGVGLLEAIEQSAINALADEHDNNGDGISGRINWVWEAEQKKRLPGRFGLKANRHNLRQVTALAFANDIGITNPAAPNQPCTAQQSTCIASPHGNDEEGAELAEHLLQLVTNFSRNLAVPQQRPLATATLNKGQQHFHQLGCASCHQPDFITASNAVLPHLRQQHIWPYSDLLLHDMGPGLADNRPDFDASGQEWRTAPLWGVGLSKAANGSNHLLHDGRARGVEEAILWHGGEAQAAKEKFAALLKREREYLIQFVEAL